MNLDFPPSIASKNSPRPAKPKKPSQGPAYKKPIAKPRPVSAPLGRPAKKVKETGPVFLPFGYRDEERVTGSKKTHNVRASADVSFVFICLKYFVFSSLAIILSKYEEVILHWLLLPLRIANH